MEGVLRWRNRLYGELRDMCFYGRLRPEWESAGRSSAAA
jgi:hypothetical protein